MPNYITGCNQLIMKYASAIPGACLYGQNLNNGTFISGLTKNIAAHPTGKVINTGNCENTLCGAGFGMMLMGVTSVYFVKQLDFMLLGMDHFVNTYSFIRCSRDLSKLGSFTIILLVCDQGLQGPQSSVNSYADYGSVARVPCYTLTNAHDADYILRTQLTAPGFRMIAMSMKLFRTEFQPLSAIHTESDASVIQYADGNDATIVCYNFALADGVALQKKFSDTGKSAALFQANYVPEPQLAKIRESVARTGKLVILDDSKSVNLPCYHLIDHLHESGLSFRRIIVRHEKIDFGISDEKYIVNADAILAKLA